MATFTNIQTTEAGQVLLAQIHAGSEQLTITAIAFGSGLWTEEEYAARNLTTLKNEILRVAPSGGEQSGGVADITCVLNNAALETGFALTELGVIAKKADNSEVLYMVDSVPAAKSTWISPASEHLMQIPVELRIACSSTSQINIRIESTAPVTSADLDKHNNAADAHPPLQAHITDKNDPHGTIPVNGETGQVLIKQEDGSIAWGTVAGVPVGELCISTNGEALPGTISANVKQKILCSLAPQLFEWMKGGTYLTDEAAWDAEAAAQDGSCGKYCWDGGEYFILPCYTKYFAAAHGDKEAGDWSEDEFKEHTHNNGVADNDVSHNVYGKTEDDAPGLATRSAQSYNYPPTFQGITSAEGGTETRPKTVHVLPCIKAFDVAINAAQIDMQALAQQVAAINGNKVDKGDVNYLNSSSMLKSTRTTSGTWVITGLDVTKFLLITCSSSGDQATSYRTLSGSDDGLATDSKPWWFQSDDLNSGTAHSALFKLNENTLSLKINTQGAAAVLRAYQ